jgi:hypothetical protein
MRAPTGLGAMRRRRIGYRSRRHSHALVVVDRAGLLVLRELKVGIDHVVRGMQLFDGFLVRAGRLDRRDVRLDRVLPIADIFRSTPYQSPRHIPPHLTLYLLLFLIREMVIYFSLFS